MSGANEQSELLSVQVLFRYMGPEKSARLPGLWLQVQAIAVSRRFARFRPTVPPILIQIS
ncbi:hypothetical protein [Bacillus badius]|uniref:Mobile element protein n=1 Tax=Bacillus badius TaxID=1455 RepID=A0ABR5AVG0_BACBA|nr:hypothetical protein [Bacillus badius]KIL76613.1 hypothetical protein SD78_0715 [Bacillus badius]KIL78731.1 hypothetical protein SD77_4411 [Bacillus badius]KZR57641.1 hypothetical protein A3781_02330 [Bacillus badius]